MVTEGLSQFNIGVTVSSRSLKYMRICKSNLEGSFRSQLHQHLWARCRVILCSSKISFWILYGVFKPRNICKVALGKRIFVNTQQAQPKIFEVVICD